MHRLTAALLYFLIAYGAGFAFGVIREFFVTPYVGLLLALCIELPFTAAVSFLTARFVMDRSTRETPADGLIVGFVALAFLLITEDVMSRILRGISVFTLWENFNWVAALVNYVGLTLFMAMPWLVSRQRATARQGLL
jgi:hypothetical protein